MTIAPADLEPPLRIAIDARLNAYRIGGIPQYTMELVAALAALAPEDELMLLGHRRMVRQKVAYGSNVRWRRFWTPPHNRW